MAEPIRKTALPVHRRPQGARPHPRPRPLPWVQDEAESEPIPRQARRARTAVPAPRPAPALPEDSAPAMAEVAETARYRSQTFQPVSRKKLRAVLQTAIGLHLAAVVLLFLFPSAGQPSGLSDTLLAAAVLLAGGTVLAFGALGRRV